MVAHKVISFPGVVFFACSPNPHHDRFSLSRIINEPKIFCSILGQLSLLLVYQILLIENYHVT